MLQKTSYIPLLLSLGIIAISNQCLADATNPTQVITIQNDLPQTVALYQVQNGNNEISITTVTTQANSSANTCTIQNNSGFSYTLAPTSAAQPTFSSRNPNWINGDKLANSGNITIQANTSGGYTVTTGN